jgi:hypothetical protein
MSAHLRIDDEVAFCGIADIEGVAFLGLQDVTSSVGLL